MPQTGLWHFRVHYDDYSPELIVNFMKDKADVAICVLENDATRSHIHTVITEFRQTKSTFVQQFLKQFPKLSGNGCYSCSKKDDYDAQLRYCLKGESKETLPIILVCREGIDWKNYHSQYWEENSLLKSKSKEGNMGLQKDSSLVTKVKSKTWTEKVFDEIKELFPEHVNAIQQFPKDMTHTPLEIQKEQQSRIVIYNYMKKRLGCKKQSDYILRDIFTGLMSGLIQEGPQISSENYNLQEYVRIFCSK